MMYTIMESASEVLIPVLCLTIMFKPWLARSYADRVSRILD